MFIFFHVVLSYLKFTYLSICLCLSVCLNIYLSVYLSIYISVCLSVYLSIYQSICLSIYLLTVYLFLYQSIYRLLSYYNHTSLSSITFICLRKKALRPVLANVPWPYLGYFSQTLVEASERFKGVS